MMFAAYLDVIPEISLVLLCALPIAFSVGHFWGAIILKSRSKCRCGKYSSYHNTVKKRKLFKYIFKKPLETTLQWRGADQGPRRHIPQHFSVLHLCPLHSFLSSSFVRLQPHVQM